MPVVKLYQNGLTAGCPPRHVNQNPAPRGDCKGWSLRTSRGNTRFLYSVVSADLPVSADDPPRLLLGLSGSLTVGDCRQLMRIGSGSGGFFLSPALSRSLPAALADRVAKAGRSSPAFRGLVH